MVSPNTPPSKSFRVPNAELLDLQITEIQIALHRKLRLPTLIGRGEIIQRAVQMMHDAMVGK